MTEDAETESEDAAPSGAGTGEDLRVWLLVARTARRPAVEAVAAGLREDGVRADVVAITDVIGSAAREAVAGGAERILRSLRVAWGQDSGPEHFLEAMRREQPDLLVVCSPRYARPLSLVESLTGAGAVQVGLPLDFTFPDAWTEGSIDGFVLPRGVPSDWLATRGYGGARLYEAGPPLLPTISADWDRRQVRAEIGLSEDERSVVVRADSFEPDRLEKLVFQATLVDEPFRFLFHHNGDGGIADLLRRTADRHGLPASMFGRVADLGRYLTAADLVVAPPADPFLPEIVALERPIVLVGGGGVGERQLEALTDSYGAVHVPDVLRVSGALEEAGGSESLDRAEAAIEDAELEPGNPAVVEAICEILGRLDRWRSGRARSAGGPDGEPDRDEPVGPFESIGTGAGGGSRGSETTDGGEQGGAGGSGLSRGEAKDQLADLILQERRLERRLSELEREQERWRNRLELARDWREDELAEEATSLLRDYIDEAEEVEGELATVREQKVRLKRAAGRNGDSDVGAPDVSGRLEGTADEPREEIEERFEEMELESDLDDLRDDIDDELGE